jgi:hypothetical protein
VAAARETWFAVRPDLDPEKLIFLDETGLNTKMARLRGRCPKGERLFASIPHGHWRTTTFVAGLRLSGIDAPMVIDGPMNGEAFLAYVEQILVPSLRPGDIVVMDNLSCHKSPAVRAAIEAAGAELRFLPPLSLCNLSGWWWQTRPRPALGHEVRAVAWGSSADRPQT